MKIAQREPLAPYTSLAVGGPGEIVLFLDGSDDLAAEVIAASHKGPVTVLGYGANCLISDKGLPGTVIFNQGGSIQQLDDTTIKVGSGVNWDEFIQYCIKHNLWGLEFSSGIPGGVGAAIVGNIAAYGHKVADCLVEVSLLDSRSGDVQTWSNEQLCFSYRSSVLQQTNHQGLVILDATFKLSSRPTGELEYDSALKTAAELGLQPHTLANRRHIIMETRRKAGSILTNANQGPWTAGSFFKNPLVDAAQIETLLSFEERGITADKLLRQNAIHGLDQARVSAAHVLLAAGFQRGQTWGKVRLHPDHILKIENIGGATAQEIYDVVQEILQTVKTKLQIELEPEVRLLGEF